MAAKPSAANHPREGDASGGNSMDSLEARLEGGMRRAMSAGPGVPRHKRVADKRVMCGILSDARIHAFLAAALLFRVLEVVQVLVAAPPIPSRGLSDGCSLNQLSEQASGGSYLQDALPVLKPPAPAPTAAASREGDTTAPACAKFEAYDKRAQTAKAFEDNCRTVDLPGSRTDFVVRLCQSALLCGQGYFTIERTDKDRCAREIAMDLSWNSNVQRYLKDHVGPDAFYLEFNGPERASFSMWSHLGNCTYKHPFRLINPGIYTVSVMHAYQSFDAVNELKEDWPVPIMDKLIEGFPLSICPECPVFTDAIVSKMDLPLCSRYEPTQGIYLRMSLETEREKYKFNNYFQPYIYVPLGCRFDQLFELHENDKCITARTTHTLTNGDSQVRTMWDLLDLRLAGSNATFQVNHNLEFRETSYFSAEELKSVNYTMHPDVTNRYKQRESDMHTEDPRFNMSRIHNVYIGTETHMASHYNTIKEWDNEKGVSGADKFFGDYDAVLVNGGHWPASGNWAGGHFSIERYVDLIEYASNLVPVLNSRRHLFNKTTLNYVWQGVNAFKIEPNPEDFAGRGKDWRVNYRLRIYSEFAERVWRRRGVKMLNSFDITLPWAQYSPDRAHLYWLPALDAQVDELLHKWNLCNY
ncbi:hypothetical protein BC830DRAFT_1168843 [Chytriomyces sp. MP71]|nr:hypothetical protein BC830DRAFT_1168843 [Chytriomyces sp. MP71]